jgi:hypothetical protein
MSSYNFFTQPSIKKTGKSKGEVIMKRKVISGIFIMATFFLLLASCVKTGADAAKSADVKQQVFC